MTTLTGQPKAGIRMEQRTTHDRRAVLPRPHLPERRTGFDRRRPGPLHALRDAPGLLAGLLGMFVVLSVADGALTAYELWAALASEGNPVLAALLERSPLVAAAFKLALTGLVALAIWQGRRYRKVLAVGVFAVVLYGALLAYHLGSLWGAGVI